jgi:hypothetical protein
VDYGVANRLHYDENLNWWPFLESKGCEDFVNRLMLVPRLILLLILVNMDSAETDSSESARKQDGFLMTLQGFVTPHFSRRDTVLIPDSLGFSESDRQTIVSLYLAARGLN